MSEQQIKKVKITLVGDQAVGKTQIVNYFINQTFMLQYRQTVGCEFGNKQMQIKDDLRMIINLWDVASSSLSSNMLQTYLYQSNIILVVYDLTNKPSFDKAIQIINNIRSINEFSNLNLALVSNKADIFHLSQVKMQDHSKVVNDHQIQSYFVSAQNGNQINEMFQEIINKIINIPISFQKDLKSQENQHSTNNKQTNPPNPNNQNNTKTQKESSPNKQQNQKMQVLQTTQNYSMKEEAINQKINIPKNLIKNQKSKNCLIF